MSQIYKTEKELIPKIYGEDKKVSSLYTHTFTAIISINSVLALLVAASKWGGLFTKPFWSTLWYILVTGVVVCYVNICWHFYGLQTLHVQKIK